MLRLKGVTAITGHVGDIDSIRRAFTGAEIVFHLARAKAHGALPREAFAVNAGGSRNVGRVAIECGVSRVVHCSSSAVYGSRVGLVREDSPLRPDSAYARSKLMAETAMAGECGKSVVIARITAVMGPGGRTWLVSQSATREPFAHGEGLNAAPATSSHRDGVCAAP